MICPHCRQFTPDQGFQCIRCGAAISRTQPAAGAGPIPPAVQGSPRLVQPWMVLLGALLLVLGYVALKRANRGHAVNAFEPGAEFSVASRLQPGKTNIVDFYSDYCPPCRRISPLLAELAGRRSDLAVIKVDINRRGVTGIDWSSPVARQYNLSSIPHFQIYDGGGRLRQEGREAYLEVMRMLAQAGIEL